MAELALPRFKGKPGWEFTDLSRFNLSAFTPAAPGEGDAAAVDRVATLLEAPEGAIHLGQVDGRVIEGVNAIDSDVVVLPVSRSVLPPGPVTYTVGVEGHYTAPADSDELIDVAPSAVFSYEVAVPSLSTVVQPGDRVPAGSLVFFHHNATGNRVLLR